MRIRELNDWMVLNNIIYKIYSTQDEYAMRCEVLEQLKMVIDFDAADFYLAEPAGQGLRCPALYNCEDTNCDDLDSLDYSRGILYSGKTVIYRETDIFSDEERTKTEYYQRVYKPNNWHFSMQVILYYQQEFMGVITFYRTIGKDNFEYDDIFIMDMLKNHLAYRLHSDRAAVQNPIRISAEDAVKAYDFTKREEDVFRLLLDGLDNQQIADQLVISVHTLKKHILNIYRKAGVNNRLSLLRKMTLAQKN